MTRVLVTDAGRGSALSIIRSLGKRGIEVIAADANARSPGFVSRYAAGRLVYPRPATDARAAVETLVSAAREQGIDLIVPVGEDVVVVLSAARERLAGIAALALPEPDALSVARDKLATVELARRLSIPAPKTVLVESAAEAVAEASEFAWPVVLKPQASRALRDGRGVEPFGVAYARDPAQLERAMRGLEGRCAVLLQEYFEGEGHGVGVLMDRGRPLLAFQHRRLREVPFTGGPSSFRESVPLDAALLDHSMRLLGELEWTGPAMVEFKVGPDGASLMEINGRIWGSLPLAVKSGMDFPARMVELYLSDRSKPPATPQFDYAVGVRSRDLSLEISWIASVLTARTLYPFLRVPSRRDAVRAALGLLDPRDGFDILSLQDPRPGLVELFNLGGKIASRLPRSRRNGARANG